MDAWWWMWMMFMFLFSCLRLDMGGATADGDRLIRGISKGAARNR